MLVDLGSLARCSDRLKKLVQFSVTQLADRVTQVLGQDVPLRCNTFVGVMDSALAQSEYLVGSSFTLADAAAIPYVNRADMLGLAGLWENRRPRVADWYARMRQRPIFNSAITAYWDDDARHRFDVPRDEVWAECSNILL